MCGGVTMKIQALRMSVVGCVLFFVLFNFNFFIGRGFVVYGVEFIT
jgi:hypothetical protein